MNGLKLLDSASGQFRTVPIGKANSAFSLLVHKDRLLIATARDGFFEFDGVTARPILADTNAISYFIAALSRHNPDRVWIGSDKGLVSLRRDASSRWIEEGIVAKTPAIRSIVETGPDSVWLGTESHGAYRVKLENTGAAGPPRASSVEAFAKADGLGTDGGVDVVGVLGHLAFVSPQGVREFDPATRRFFESAFFKNIPAGGEAGGSNQAVDANGNVWINFGLRPVVVSRQPDGSYQFDQNRIRRIGDGLVTGMYGDPDGVVWFGGPDRVFRYDPSKASAGRQPSPVLLRRVTSGDREKRVLYAGGGGEAAARRPEIPYKNNELRFEYTVASFEDPSKNQFQTRLEGFDQEWSAWTSETRRDYTNLPPGNYRFLIRGRNVFSQESPEAEYRLVILPPWYRTWWAFLAYALLLAAAVFAADRILRRRVIARERAASQAKALQAEIEQKRNVELLSEMGKQLTSSLEIDTIFGKLYDNVNQLMDATIFGVGIFHPEEHTIEYRLAFDSGKRYEPYRRDTHDKNQFPVWCIDNRKPIFINDVSAEYSRYISNYQEPRNKLEDGSVSEYPQSLIYLPLIAKERVLGIITVQSRKKHAYTGYHLNLLDNLAAYTSIALDNADAYQHLKSAQEQLVTQEKLASLGALTAGIAHEIKNPLNFVNNFADLSVELMQELREELGKYREILPATDFENIEALLCDLSGNAKKINEHGRRADGIVRSMLLHSRGQAGERQPTDVNAMLDEYVNLSYHGMRAQDSSFNITIERQLAADLGKIDAIPQDLSRVFLNLLNNACYAANDKAKKIRQGYVPTLCVRTVNLGESVEVHIRDNGMGIPPDVRDRIFHPFFTTKPTGQGTGLGLSISHDIVVQEHGGQLEVETEPGEFTEFVVRLPRHWRKAA